MSAAFAHAVQPELGRTASPHALDAVGVEGGISAAQVPLLDLTLRHEQTVERIPVVMGQPGHPEGVGDRYRQVREAVAGGTRSLPLPDFYIGAHAEISGFTLVTRDVARYRTYFPKLRLITPED